MSLSCGREQRWLRRVRSRRRESEQRQGEDHGINQRKLTALICPTGKSVDRLSSPLCKNISLHPSGKSSLQILAIRPHQRGVSRSSRTRGADAVDAAAFGARWDRRAGSSGLVSDQQHADERRFSRTAKSCGPDAPTLASSSRDGVSDLPGADKLHFRWRRWQKSPVTGEQLYFSGRPVIGWPQGWRWRATASGG